MATQAYPVTEKQSLRLVVNGDLFLSSSDQPQVKLSVDEPRDLVVRLEGELIDVVSRDDTIVVVPEFLNVVISTISGDCDLRDLKSEIKVGQVGGDFTAQRLEQLSVDAIGGDCEIKQISQAVQIHAVGGDVIGVELTNPLALDGAGGDVDLISIHQDVSVKAGGDINLSLVEGGGQVVDLRAGGDVAVGLPEGTGAKLDLISNSRDIIIRWGGERQNVESHRDTRTLGDGSILVRVEAGGDIVITDQPRGDDRWQRPFDRQEERWQRAQQRVRSWERAMDETNRRIAQASERAARRAEEAARRAEQRVQETMRRLEQRRQGWVGQPVPFGEVEVKPSSRVTDDERRLILQMLADGKITAEEANKLLQALESLGQ